ncbi:MAG: ABC transporter ATP-binding protein [Candidatus Lokiarchaeota archaeon]|nr:ABC transporter ATP-binding protein [Candidatus Lokiarchaeota archaeon]
MKFQNIEKSYKDTKALKGVSFEIKKGEIFGYIGPNGAGKTTTIKILIGLIRDYTGSILINGEPLDYGSNGFHKILGYLPQDVGFQEWRTVDHALMTFGRLSGLHKEEIKARIPKVLDLVTLENVRNKNIRKLSGGMQQKLLFAQALLHDPEFLVLDEPMTGLDPLARYHMKTVFQRVAKESGKTIFFSTHILSDLEGVCNTLGVLNNGQIIKIGTPKDFREEYRTRDIVEIVYSNGTPKLADVGAMEMVEEVSMAEDGTQRIVLKRGNDLDASLARLMASLVGQGCRVRNFNLVRPSLDDVYLQLIGGRKA